jgi:hypothetical protein
MLFSELISLSLSDTSFLGLHSSEINFKFVNGFVVFLPFLIQTKHVDCVVNNLPFNFLVDWGIGGE